MAGDVTPDTLKSHQINYSVKVDRFLREVSAFASGHPA
jgi:hypothetical protein